MSAPSPPILNGTSELFAGPESLNQTNTTFHPLPPSIPHNTIKDYEIVKAKPADFDEILAFMMSDFLYTEPLNAALDVSEEESRDFFSDIIHNCFPDGLSYVVRSTKDNRIVALRLTSILDKASPEEAQTFATDDPSPKIQAIKNLLHGLESQIWKLIPPEFNRLMCWIILSVDQSFSRRGIARQLITHNLDEARQKGCQGIFTEASAFNSQQLFQKCGYQRLLEVVHADWKDSTGKPVFCCKDQTRSATLEFKPL
jgi:GNAT superfamily N-acetyltransferase